MHGKASSMSELFSWLAQHVGSLVIPPIRYQATSLIWEMSSHTIYRESVKGEEAPVTDLHHLLTIIQHEGMVVTAGKPPAPLYEPCLLADGKNLSGLHEKRGPVCSWKTSTYLSTHVVVNKFPWLSGPDICLSDFGHHSL